MKERMHVAESKKSSESEVFRTDARMEYVLTLFDIRAQAFLELVVDAETQNAFVNLLGSFELVAWQEYAGYGPDDLRPIGANELFFVDMIRTTAQRWIRESQERVKTPEANGEQAGHPSRDEIDPRTWSPLIQEWQAHTTLKNVITGPGEKIPESFLRNSISRRLGIRPEEVTGKQIQIAVAFGLLGHYGKVIVTPAGTSDESGQAGPSDKPNKADEKPPMTAKNSGKARRSMGSLEAVAAVKAFMAERHWNTTEFSRLAGCTDRTIRRFLQKTRMRRSCFDTMASNMGITREQLLRGEYQAACPHHD